MDKEKECDVPESVFIGSVSKEAGEKQSNFFKEPEGMTTICLSDAPIPDERRLVEKFTIVNGARKRTRLLWILMSIILVLLIFTLYENEGLNIFQNTQTHVLCEENHNNMSLLCSSVNGIKRFEYTVESTEPENKTSTSEITSSTVNSRSKEDYTQLENSISGSLVINPNFFGIATKNSDNTDEGPTNIMDVLNMFGYVSITSKPNRKKRSQQNENADAFIVAPPKLSEDCDIKETENDGAKDLKILQQHESENGSERSSSHKQNGQKEGSNNKLDTARSKTMSLRKSGNNKDNNEGTSLKHITLPVSEKLGKETVTSLVSTPTTKSSHKDKNQSPTSAISDGGVVTNTAKNVKATMINISYEKVGQKATLKNISDVSVFEKDHVQHLDNKTKIEIFQSIEPEYIATPITETSLMKETQSILKEQGKANKAENAYLSEATNHSTNSTNIPKKQVNYEYFESEELDKGNTDLIDNLYIPFSSTRSSSTHKTTPQPHIDSDYTVDPYYEQERNDTHDFSSYSFTNSSSQTPNNENVAKSAVNDLQFVRANIATDDNMPLKMEFPIPTENTATTKTTHSAEAIDSSTKTDLQVSTNVPLTTEPTSALSAAINDTTPYSSEPKKKDKEVTALSKASTENFSQFKTYSSVSPAPAFVKISDTDKNNSQNAKLEDILGMKIRTNSANQRKQNGDSSFSEQMQSNQMKENQYPCSFPSMGYPMPQPQYYPPFPPYPYPSPGNDQLKIVNVPFPKQQGPIVILNPPVINYGPPYMMAPQNFPQVGSSYGDYSPVSPIQSVDPKGQFYVCNAIPAPLPQVVTVPAVEVRKMFAQGVSSRERTFSNTKPLECPIDQVSCSDNSRCIKQNHICDGEADCKDGNDEANCTCKDRIETFRHCDGYIDCPEGEDEIGCFECSENEFSCNDWNPRYRRSTCIPLEQRCDGIEQCPVGFDEIDCSVLTDTLEEDKLIKVSNAVGFLNRNYKGKWYPTCFGTEIWAAEVCKTESGPNPHHLIPESRLMNVQGDYKGPYIEETQNEGLHLKEKCAMEGTATFVRCPPLICGMRLKIHNPYRMQEIETSHEILGEMPPDQQSSEDILGDSRIVGGDGSQPASWPWVVTMYKNGIFHCSGVIINELWIVSAAHCVDKYWLYYYEIQAGVLRRFSYAPQTQIRWVTHAIPYATYNKSTLQHDIALLKLSAPLRYNRYVRPICLPSESTAGINYFNAPYPGTECTVVGWGATSEHAADPDHLREVRVPVLPVCKYEEDRETNAICAGFTEGGRDACQGDSGGPFMCLNPNHPHQWYLAGIVSHGEGCARPDEPGIYTRVSLYVEWIMEHVNSQQHLPPQGPLQECPGYVCRETNRCISKKRHCDKIVDCLHGDDELNCFGWKLDEYFKHMQYVVGRDSHSSIEDNEKDVDTRDQIVREPLNLQLPPNGNLWFTCKRLLQRIPLNKRCNRVADCEDGTDEMRCTCRDYLLTTASNSICDGITDCADLSDEKNCSICDKNYGFKCHLSKTCISLKKRCDGKADCDHGEDEWDCLALANGTAVILDVDGLPELRSSGVIVSNYRGNWKVTCTTYKDVDKQAPFAAFMCNYLGFNDYHVFKIFPIDKLRNTTLKPFSSHSTFVKVNVEQECALFYVKCSGGVVHTKLQFTETNTLAEQLYTPWIARIYVNGGYRCAGVLIDLSWVLTSSYCFQSKLQHNSFLTVLLGTRKGNALVQGPYEQIVAVSNRFKVSNSTAILLKLLHPVIYTRYVRPITLHMRNDISREKCLATDADEHNNLKTVILKVAAQRCEKGFKCFSRGNPANKTCTSKPWSGVIVCESGAGWYPSALFSETKGYCGFNGVVKYPVISTLINKIAVIMRNTSVLASLPKCNGFRCKLGQCIESAKACDGVPDCRSAEDEEQSYCAKLKATCQKSKNCTCSKLEIRCANGKCVSKKAFCNAVNDCGDGSDEPANCSCKDYLELTEPNKICDSVVHCGDNTDERFCACDGSNFKCGRSSTCVANATICDGVYDCPKGEDEENCFALKSFNGRPTSGEVIVRTAGEWYSGCFPRIMDQSKLSAICNILNFKSEHPKQLNLNKPEATGRAIYDRFNVVYISRKQNIPVWLKIRSGLSPYITFNSSIDNNCYKLFVDCR